MPSESSSSALAAASFIFPKGLKQGLPVSDSPTVWNYAAFAGRLGEISAQHASAALTLAFQLVLEAQRRNEPTVWVTGNASAFYPPDAAEAAIDLDALIVVRVPDNRRSARAADALLRSGGFGLVVLDLGADTRGLNPQMQSRLVGLAKKHQAALICLTEKQTHHPSIGSLVSIRAEAMRKRERDDRYTCRAQILKDKRRGPGWQHKEVFRGPDGLR
jgi:recombination protein RecA